MICPYEMFNSSIRRLTGGLILSWLGQEYPHLLKTSFHVDDSQTIRLKSSSDTSDKVCGIFVKRGHLNTRRDTDAFFMLWQLMNTYLRSQMVCLRRPLLSEDPDGMRKRLREQMSIYSLQFKEAADSFGKTRQILSGKVGGMKDDVVIALQLAAYWSKEPHMYA